MNLIDMPSPRDWTIKITFQIVEDFALKRLKISEILVKIKIEGNSNALAFVERTQPYLSKTNWNKTGHCFRSRRIVASKFYVCSNGHSSERYPRRKTASSKVHRRGRERQSTVWLAFDSYLWTSIAGCPRYYQHAITGSDNNRCFVEKMQSLSFSVKLYLNNRLPLLSFLVSYIYSGYW